MFRFALSALALAAALASAQPAVFADPASTDAVKHAQAVAGEPSVVVPAAGVNVEHRAAPAGFGWG